MIVSKRGVDHMSTQRKYNLSTLLDGLEMVSQDNVVYMHKDEQTFIPISDDDIDFYKRHFLDQSQLRDWERDLCSLLHSILDEDENSYIKMPTAYDINEHQLMVDFAFTCDVIHKDQLIGILYKKGAFSQFKQYI